MSKHQGHWLRVTILSLFASSIFVAGQSVTRADPINFSIVTTGCFGIVGDTPCSSTELTGLHYSPNVFGAVNDLGTLTLSGNPESFADNTFTLKVEFTQPSGITGQPFIFNATISPLYEESGGNLTLLGLSILFDDPLVRTFSVLGPDGSVQVFQFSVSHLEIRGGSGTGTTGDPGSGQLSGGVASVPEPASLLLFGTGLTGLIGYARRRRKRNPTQ